MAIKYMFLKIMASLKPVKTMLKTSERANFHPSTTTLLIITYFLFMEPFKFVEIRLVLLVDQNTKCYIDNAFLLLNFIHSETQAIFFFFFKYTNTPTELIGHSPRF